MDQFTGLPSGTVLDGRYRLGGLIARGGMSTVYRGVDLRLDRPVAVKVMAPQYVADPAFLSRFEREARVAAGLGHPGVVAVYDQGRDGDLVFLVMELVDGGTLRDLLREKGALPVPVALSILEPLLAALGAAHAAGLVHRDVKPENVLISSRGTVKIADFGLVRAVSSQTLATGDVILGTVAYLSPEQVATGAADPRSDVYGAGIVAYEMLTGAPPYAGDNPMSVAYQHVHSDVPAPALRVPEIPAALDELIVAATRRNPAARPRDAAAFLSALVTARTRLGVRRVPVPVPHRPAPVVPVAVAGPALAHGPGGTAMMAAGGPLTIAERDPAAPPPIPAEHTRVGSPSVPAGGPAPSPLSESMALRRKHRRRWAIAVVLIVVLGLLAAAGGWWLGGRWSSTPPSIGLSQAAAEAAVRDAGLVPRVTVEHHNEVAAGMVAASVPTAGTEQLRGSEVDLLVSSGRPQVPDIAAGTDPAAATSAIRAADLTIGPPTAPVPDDAVALGALLRTDPAAGTALPIGAPVSLVLSAGPADVEVPQVAGKLRDDAENKLRVDGFALGPPVPTYDSTAERGTVLGSRPAAGATAPKGSAVSLLVAEYLTVPAVRGRTTEDARTALEQAGFEVTVGDPAFDAGIDAGDVLRTDPSAGARVDPQRPRVFVVPSNAVTVPDVTAGTVQQARDTLRGLGLTASESVFFGGDYSTVWSQSPGPGGRVEPGGTVEISAFW